MVELKGDGAKSLLVKVKGQGGKETSSRLDFTLDTVVDIPVSRQEGGFDIGNPRLWGTAEEGAQLIVRKELTKEIISASTANMNGNWSAPITNTVKVSGLKKLDGSDSKANGTYNVLFTSEAATLVKSFSKDFSDQGASLLDLSKPAFSLKENGEAWYLWPSTTGHYIVSHLDDSQEWYRARIERSYSSNLFDQLSGWQATDKPASELDYGATFSDGSKEHLRDLADVRLTLQHPGSRSYLDYEVIQVDRAGNVSNSATGSTSIGHSGRPIFDLNERTRERENFVHFDIPGNYLKGGMPFVPSFKPDDEFDSKFENDYDRMINEHFRVKQILVRYEDPGRKNSGDMLMLKEFSKWDEKHFFSPDTNEKWNVNQDVPLLTQMTVGGVQGVDYSYDSGRSLLTLSKTNSDDSTGFFTYKDVRQILGSIILQNPNGAAGYRSLEVSLQEKFSETASYAYASLNVLEDEGTEVVPMVQPLAPTPQPVDEIKLELRFSSRDGVTRDGYFKIRGIAADTIWRWSEDGGRTWSERITGGDGAAVQYGDGQKSVTVEVWDKAGAVTTHRLDFVVDRTAEAPTVDKTEFEDGNLLLTGTAEKGAYLIFESHHSANRIYASEVDGKWSLSMRAGFAITGLTKVDGSNSSANGEYVTLSFAEKLKLKQRLSEDFSPDKDAVLDLSHTAYALETPDETWYLWTQVGGGRVISRQSGAHEWYKENDYQTDSFRTWPPYTRWTAASIPARYLMTEAILEDGSRSHQRNLQTVDLRPLIQDGEYFSVVQIDRLNNQSEKFNFYLHITDTVPEGFRADHQYSDNRSLSKYYATDTDIARGVRFAPHLELPGSEDQRAYRIGIKISGNGLQRDSDKLSLEPGHNLEISLDRDFEIQKNGVINGVSSVTYHYSADKNELTISRSDYSYFNKREVEQLIQAIKLKNIDGGTGTRVLTADISGWGKRSIWEGVLEVTDQRLSLRTAPVADSLEDASIRYIKTAGLLKQGIELHAEGLAPKAKDIRSLQLTLSGKGLDRDHDRLFFDFPLNKRNEAINDLRYFYDSDRTTLTISNGSGAPLSGSQVQTLLKSAKLVNPLGLDGEREVQFRLIATNGEVGVPAVTRLVIDTQAPPLDLDYFMPGIQSSSLKVINLKRAAEGESLFDKRISASFADDLTTIKLSFSGNRDTFASDQLVLHQGVNGALSLAEDRNAIDLTIGSVTGLSYGYQSSTSTLILQKTSGKSLSGLEVKQILEALQLKVSSTALDYRNIDITLTDRAGNSGLAKASIKLDMTPASELKVELIPQNQLSYQVLNLGDTLGRTYSHNLSKGESITLAKPAGMSAQKFLSAIKGISAEWGGRDITGNANTTSSAIKSYLGLDTPLLVGKSFVMAHQGSSDIKASIFNFTLTPDGKGLVLNHKGGTNLANQDMYEFGGTAKPSNGNYDIGNIRILYQVDTGASNLNPTVNVKFDPKKASVGDVISLRADNHTPTSKVLTTEDLASPEAMVSMKITNSLPASYHFMRAEHQEVSGNVSSSGPIFINSTRPGNVANPVLSELKVGSPNQAAAKLLNDSTTQYASITENGTTASPGSSERGLVFSGKVDGAGASDQYLVTVKAGDKVLAFDTVKAGNFTLASAVNLLAPGVYDDLSFTATNITAGNNNGATASIGGLKLGSFWAAQSLGDTRGGNGDDNILLGATKKGANTLIQANGGHDTFTLGAFGKKGNFAATVTDFSLSVDKLAVFGKSVDALNLDKFVKEVAPIQGGAGTRLVIDLDGAGAGTQTYSLHLQNVAYNPANTHTLFGV